MPVLRCHFLGNPCFFKDETQVRPGRRKAVALAAYLVVTEKVHSREALAGLFWPDASREKARASLRRTLSEMIRILGRSWIAADRETVGALFNDTLWDDVHAFTALSRGKGKKDLEAAAQRYTGGFLSGFSLGDASGFDDWAIQQNEDLNRRIIRVLGRLVHMLMEAGQDNNALDYAVRWTELDPLNEAAHRQLIRIYSRLGEKGLALRQYETCRTLLGRDLGISPEKETRVLIRDICSPDPGKVPGLETLPDSVYSLVGRQEDVLAVCNQINHPDTRLVTLTGPGGIGKTRLAVAVAAALASDFPQGIFFVSAAKILSIPDLVATLARSLGIGAGTNGKIQNQVIRFIADKTLLLVLDNLEHLPRAAGLISKMLARSRKLKILATSRSRLMLNRERLYPLSGLDCPNDVGRDDNRHISLEDYGSAALFLQAARQVKPGFHMDTDDRRGVARICCLTQGLPLALILAGGWCDVLSPGQIAGEIAAGLDVLRTENRDTPRVHQSMRAVFDASCRHLSREEHLFFMALGVFRGEFTGRAAAAVAGEGYSKSIGLLAALVRKSMVFAQTGEKGFSLHPLMGRYAREKLAEAGGTEAALDRHEHYFLALPYRNEKGLIGNEMTVCRKTMDLALADITQAWNRAVTLGRGDHDRLERLSRAATGLYIYFDMHTQYMEGERFFNVARPLLTDWNPLRELSGPKLGILLLCWYDMQAQGTAALGSHRTVLAQARRWLKAAVKCGDLENQAQALLLMGVVAHQQKVWDRAVRRYRLCLELCPEMERAFWVTIRMGLCRKAQGDLSGALAWFQKSLATGEHLGDEVKIAWSLGNLGSAFLCLGNLEEAGILMSRAMAGFEKIDALVGQVLACQELGLLSLLKGEPEKAVGWADQALDLCGSAGLSRAVHRRTRSLKGLCLVVTGDLAGAGICLETAREDAGFTFFLAGALLALLKKDVRSARLNINRAREQAHRVHKPQLCILLALAEAGAHHLDRAYETATRSIPRVIEHTHCPWDLFRAWPWANALISRYGAKP